MLLIFTHICPKSNEPQFAPLSSGYHQEIKVSDLTPISPLEVNKLFLDSTEFDLNALIFMNNNKYYILK